MKKILYSVVFMFLIALVFTSLVSAVKLSHEERILRNQQAKLQKTILKVLGIPVRVTISPRTLERNSIEIKWRSEKEPQLLPLEGAVTRLKELITRREN